MPNNSSDVLTCNSISYSFGAKIQGIIPVIVQPEENNNVIVQSKKSEQYVSK